MIEAVIFDMDGVIIESEPLWKKAEQKIFKNLGIELNDELCSKTTGLDVISTVKYWYSFKPWKSKSFSEIADEITNEIIFLIKINGIIKEGVTEIFDFFIKKNIPLAVASSSSMKIIHTVLEKLKLRDKFAAIYSSEYEEFGKPHPGVYISTAKQLNIQPENCLVFEDSFYGSLAAKSARMKVFSILNELEYQNTKFDFTDLKIRSFNEFTEKEFEKINSIL